MNCQFCGAPMTLYRRQDYFFCRYCGSFHFPTVSVDGVRLLGETPQPIDCPFCRVRMQVASFDDRYRGYQCGKCRSILLDRFVFRDLVQARRAAASTPPAPPQRLDRTQMDRHLKCPQCARPMDTHPYYGPGNIIIDTCHHCNLIWLDYAELNQVVDAPGKDRPSGFQW